MREGQQGVGEDVAFGMELRGLLDALHRRHLREDLAEEAALPQPLHPRDTPRADEQPEEFVANALRADPGNRRGVGPNGLEGLLVDDEVEFGGQADGPQHAQVVLGEPRLRVAHGADAPRR